MTKLREFLRRLLGALVDAVSVGDIVFVVGVVFIFRGLELVYGIGWAYIGVGSMLAATLYLGDLFAATATLFLHRGQRKDGRTG